MADSIKIKPTWAWFLQKFPFMIGERTSLIDIEEFHGTTPDESTVEWVLSMLWIFSWFLGIGLFLSVVDLLPVSSASSIFIKIVGSIVGMIALFIPPLVFAFVFGMILRHTYIYEVRPNYISSKRKLLTEIKWSTVPKEIMNIEIKQGRLGRLFNFGTIIFHTSGKAMPVPFWGVKEPYKRAREIKTLLKIR